MSLRNASHNQPGPAQTRLANAALSAAYNSLLTRRAAFAAALAAAGAAVLTALPQPALAASATQETLDALAEAEEELAEVEAQLDELADEYEALSIEQNETIASIEDKQAEIDAVQEDIDAKQVEIDAKEEEIAATEAEMAERQAVLEEKQALLAQRVSNDYKNGGTSFLQLLISSSSFEDLIANLYYADKINESDQTSIAEIQALQAELEEKRELLEEQKSELEAAQAELEATQAELEEEMASLEELKASQEEQLAEMQDMRAEISELVDSLSDEVSELMEQRDAEYLASVAEEEAQAAAAAAASSSSSSSTYSASNVPANAQQLVVSACYAVPSPGAGYCARWVSQVFQYAGFTYYGGNACDMYSSWCTSSDRSYLQTAMIIAVSSHSHTSAGRIYGHVGIYVGGSTVMDNVGYIRSIGVDSWISYFGTTVTPRWGWIGGVDLSNS